jgi:hypothetical protein
MMLSLYKYVRDCWTDFSAEGEGVSLNARNQKLDTEGMVLDGSMLPDQLIKAFFRYGAIAIRVSIYPMVRTGGFAVDRNLEADWFSSF